MTSHFSRRSFWFALTLLAFIASSATFLLAQEMTPFPENWRDLPANELVTHLQERYDEFTRVYSGISDTDMEVVRERAAELFKQINIQEAPTAEFPTITGLFRAGYPNLTDEEKAALRTALAARQDDWTGRPYIELREKVGLMGWVDLPFEDRAKEALRWVDAGGQINQVFDKDLPLYVQHIIREPQVIEGTFSVRWEGRLVAPQTGLYTFSISPINTSASYGDYVVKQSMSVNVDANPVIAATPEQWTTQSVPVQLTANQPVALVVETSVETLKLPIGELHAMLFWEGPGIAKSIVPQSSLRLPTTDDIGLRATYTWKAGGEQKTIAQVDPNIEFAWTSGRLTLSAQQSFQRLGSGTFWSKMIDPQFLTTLENNTATKIHPLLADPASSTESLSVARRQEFLSTLLAHPTLLEAINTQQAVALYKAYRIGDPEAALNVFGRWARQNAAADIRMPYETFVTGVDLDNRESYWQLAICVTQELPKHAVRLQNEFLTLEDGSCCLPVAYTLAYSYLSQNRFQEWIDLLRTKLDDEATTGDKRVNWLIARAHADEISQGPMKPYVRIKAYPEAGKVWLEEAMLVAESPAVKARVAKELAARHATSQEFNKAKELLNAAAGYAPANLTAQVNDWKKSVDDLETTNTKAQADAANNAKKAYLDKLKTRRDRAYAAGNTEAVARYDALIDASANQ